MHTCRFHRQRIIIRIKFAFHPPCKPQIQYFMEIQIQLLHKGINATYAIEQSDTITYNALLRDYSGSKPPAFIRFYKTEMGWSSAFEESELISQLGKFVDAASEPA